MPSPLALAAPELLAPAGDREALRAAVANGADAVYFGLSDFNARHRATNFTLAALPETMAYLHEHGVRGYVTFNTLIFSDELPQAAEYLAAIVRAGADAVIVQDLGIVELIRRLAPGFPIHGSTQMTLTEPRGIEFVRRLGVERVILARELSLTEIGRIRQQTQVPVEVFVHGALCVAYSGQCLTSEAIGGRSANRGQCAQACRQPYELIVDGALRDLGDKAYLLSPQDLAAYDRIGELAGLGVASLKIEGRLKSAHYVAATTQTYRAALDAAIANRAFVIDGQQELDLTQSFSRGFTNGFLGGINHQELVQGRFPKNRGVRVGNVVEIRDETVVVELDEKLARLSSAADGAAAGLGVKPGDGVVFDEGHPEQDEQGGRVFGVRRVPTADPRGANAASGATPPGPPLLRGGMSLRAGGVSPLNLPQPFRQQLPGNHSGAIASHDHVRLIELSFGRGDVNLAAVSIGANVWKTDDPALRRRLERTFADSPEQHVAVGVRISGEPGQPLHTTWTDEAGNSVEIASDAPLQAALKHPLTETLVREQFGRLGGTPFRLESIELRNLAGTAEVLGVMAPKSVLNEMRRRAVAGLIELRRAGPSPIQVDEAALEEMRGEIARRSPRLAWAEARAAPVPSRARLSVLCRTLDQLRAVLDWSPPAETERPEVVYCDFEEVRLYREAVALCDRAGQPVVLATPRIIKPREEGLLLQVARCQPAGVLVRNLAAIDFYRERFPELALYGDYSLNVTNELTADVFARQGLVRLTAGYDLNLEQVHSLLARFDPAQFEIVVHQHVPMFHMEHCVFSHVLSNGKDFHDCGRPCDRHRVELRDHVGFAHPLAADVGCRNTVFNAQPQSAAQFVPGLIERGVRHFRVELLREDGPAAIALLDVYARVIAGSGEAPRAWRELRVLNQIGLTAGTLAFE